MKQTWGDYTSAINHHSDDVTASFRKTSIDCVGWRRRRRVDTNQAEVAGQALDLAGIEGRIRTVIHDDHFIVVGIDVALIGG